jgi:hypothetical protein
MIDKNEIRSIVNELGIDITFDTDKPGFYLPVSNKFRDLSKI